jgi:hypothetical protein
VVNARRSYGCGGSGATRKNPFSLFPIKSFPQKEYRLFLFGCEIIINPNEVKVNSFIKEKRLLHRFYLS